MLFIVNRMHMFKNKTLMFSFKILNVIVRTVCIKFIESKKRDLRFLRFKNCMTSFKFPVCVLALQCSTEVADVRVRTEIKVCWSRGANSVHLYF